VIFLPYSLSGILNFQKSKLAFSFGKFDFHFSARSVVLSVIGFLAVPSVLLFPLPESQALVTLLALRVIGFFNVLSILKNTFCSDFRSDDRIIINTRFIILNSFFSFFGSCFFYFLLYFSFEDLLEDLGFFTFIAVAFVIFSGGMVSTVTSFLYGKGLVDLLLKYQIYFVLLVSFSRIYFDSAALFITSIAIFYSLTFVTFFVFESYVKFSK